MFPKQYFAEIPIAINYIQSQKLLLRTMVKIFCWQVFMIFIISLFQQDLAGQQCSFQDLCAVCGTTVLSATKVMSHFLACSETTLVQSV
jgi:hypothetical protein